MENYEDFKKSYFKLSGINLDAYKENQMRRRIETLIARKGFDSFETYARRIKTDRNELENFTDYITINVTEFFRNPEYWKFLEEEVIPVLAEKTDGKLKIWSAGCAAGQEPYSLAMIFLKYFKPDSFKILATDIDEKVLKKAEAGIFNEKSLETISEEYSELREKYFEKNQYEIDDAVKNQVEFKKLDMTAESFPQNLDLIVCRNVLIYFTEEVKQEIYRKFCESLKTGGILFSGHTEQIVYYKDYGFEKLAKNFYRKR